MRGLVYYAVCSSCGETAQRRVARGPDATYAVRARDGHRVWSFPAGKYANPVVADSERIYVTGRAHEFALARKGSKVVKDYLRARARKAETRAVTSRSTSSEARGSPRTWSEWSRPASSRTSSAGLPDSIPSPQIGSSGLPTSERRSCGRPDAPPRSPAGSAAA